MNIERAIHVLKQANKTQEHYVDGNLDIPLSKAIDTAIDSLEKQSKIDWEILQDITTDHKLPYVQREELMKAIQYFRREK